MNSISPTKGFILLLLIMATPCYGAKATISYDNTHFYILKNQPFETISCTIEPDAATKFLAHLKEKPDDITIDYTIEENLSGYNFILNHDGTFELSPTTLQLHFDEPDGQDSIHEKSIIAAHAWQQRVETGYEDLIAFSSQLVVDGFGILTPDSPEGDLIASKKKNETITFIYGSLFSKTILRYKKSEKGYLLTKNSTSHSSFKEKLSSNEFTIEYQTINHLIIPKRFSRSLYTNRSINGKKSSAQEMVVTLKDCLVEK